MIEFLHHALGRLIWRSLMISIVLVAIYVTSIRALFEALPNFSPSLVDSLSRQIGGRVEVGDLAGELIGFSPNIKLEQLRLTMPESPEIPIVISSAALTLDPWATLMALEPRLDILQLEGLQLSYQLDDANNPAPKTTDIARLADILRAFRQVNIIDSTLQVHSSHGARLPLDIELELRRMGSRRQFKLRLEAGDDTAITASGTGVGDVFDPRAFVGEVHGSVASRNAAPLLGLFDIEGEGRGELDFWYRTDADDPTLTTALSLHDLVVKDPLASALRLDALSFKAALHPDRESWRGTLSDLTIQSGAASLTPTRVQFDLKHDNLRLRLANLDVAELQQLLLTTPGLPVRAHDILTALAPSGRIVAAEGRLASLAAPLDSWSVSLQLEDGTVKPYRRAPGLAGIDATIFASQSGATAWIDTENFALDLPQVYKVPIEFKQVVGRLGARWQANALFLEQGVLHATADNHLARVEFGIDIPLVPREQGAPALEMSLSAGFGEVPVSARQRYVPYRIQESLYEWLQAALPKGRVESGAFIWRGGFSDFGQGSQSMQLGLSVKEAQLMFHPDWPPIDDMQGQLLVDSDRVSVWGEKARIASVSLRDFTVEADADRSVGRMDIEGDFAASGTDALNLLRRSPLKNSVAGLLDDIKSTGPLAGRIDLGFDLANISAPPEVAVDMTLSSVTLESQLLGLELQALSGGLGYSSADGFTDYDLDGVFQGEPVAIEIGRGSSGLPSADVFDARLSALVHAQDVIEWLQGFTEPAGREAVRNFPVEGETILVVDVAVGATADVRIGTDMTGLAVELPAPIGKPAEIATPFEMSFQVADDAPWELFWSERVTGRIYRRGGRMVGATADLTPRLQRVQLDDPPITSGLSVAGDLPSLEIDPWIATVANWPGTQDGARSAAPVTVGNLTVANLQIGEMALGPVEANLTPYQDWYRLGINAPWFDAEFTVGGDGSETDLIFHYLDLERLPKGANEGKVSEPPRLIAPLSVAIANLAYGDRGLGTVAFELDSQEEALRATGIHGSLAEVALHQPSELIWRRDEQGTLGVHLSLDTRLGNVGDTFRALNVEPTVDSDSGVVTADLYWPGSPADFDVMSLKGNVNVTLNNGSFLPVPAGATGFLRVLSILNLAGLFERANVTRLFEPGVTFKRARGQFLFDQGQLETPDFVIDAPGGGFAFDSNIDLETQEIDGELVVTLPLAKNIPWVAALAGGLPVAAGAYLMSKIFEDQVKSLTSGVYSVSGKLDSPVVRFERIFDAGKRKADRSSAPDQNTSDGESSSGNTEPEEDSSSVRK